MCKIYNLWKVVFFSLLSSVVVQLSLAQDIPVSSEEPKTPPEAPQRPTVVAFVNVNVVPMDRKRILPQQTVIVRADRISEIGPVDTTDIPEGALRIDGRDKYLMPGLVDMHVHLPKNYQEGLCLFIANGVTTVRNMRGENYHLKLREEINKGKLIGPTIYTTGPIIDGNPPVSPNFVVAETPEQAVQLVAEHKKAGYNFIKVYSRLSVEVYDAIIEAAAKHGMPVVGHVPSAVGLEHVLAANQYSVEHLTGYSWFLKVGDSPPWQQIDETKIRRIAQATYEADTWNCVTLVLYQKRMSSEEADREPKLAYMKYVSPVNKQRWFWSRQYRDADPNRGRKMSNRKRMTKALHDAGARILLGSDTPNPYVVPGFSLHWELRNLVDAGLTPYEAIKAGTRDAAECLGEQDKFGTISTGLRADLILIEDNPLEDVSNVARRSGVMARGRWLPQPELQAMLDALAIKHATEENPDGVMLHGHWYPRTLLEAMVEEQNKRKKEELVEAILASDRIFLAGTGISEPVARSVAMKLMQLGFQIYVAGDATTPEIEKGDLLIAISGSGRTEITYNIASAAKSSRAHVALLTSQPTSIIGNISNLVFPIGPDFYEAVGPFVNELVTLITEKRRKN
jgi:imidazolonepropionase-like amidohydrolase